LDKLKVSVVVPFKITLAAPNNLAIVGGAMAGGSSVMVEEPPPHPKTHGPHKIMNIAQFKRCCDCIDTFSLTLMNGCHCLRQVWDANYPRD
jgi:hypothetical protein